MHKSFYFEEIFSMTRGDELTIIYLNEVVIFAEYRLPGQGLPGVHINFDACSTLKNDYLCIESCGLRDF